MSKTQTMFTKNGLDVVDGLTRKDLILKVSLERTKVLCPRCLYYGTLWEFSKTLKNKRHDHYISMSRVQCPDCTEGLTKKTILKVADMDMEEFGHYFWGGCFQQWGTGDKIRWNTFMKRLKKHWAYEDRQEFWDVYWEYKGEKPTSDDDAYAEYQRTYQPPSQKPQVDEHDVDIVTVLKFLVTQKHPLETKTIQYVLTSKVPPRRVSRALETMQKEGTVTHTDKGWVLTKMSESPPVLTVG